MDRWLEAEKALKVRTAREREIQISGLNQAYGMYLKLNPTHMGTPQAAEFAKAIDDRIAAIRGGTHVPVKESARPADEFVEVRTGSFRSISGVIS